MFAINYNKPDYIMSARYDDTMTLIFACGWNHSNIFKWFNAKEINKKYPRLVFEYSNHVTDNYITSDDDYMY